MPKIKTNGIDIYYEIHGSGSPLVLISGLGYPAWEWHKMAPHLAEKFQVITFDNRGVGQSDKPAGPYTASMLAADVAGLLDAFGVEKAVILGHSMGGFIAQAFALEYPQRISKLILCSTNFGGPHHVPITAEAMAVLSDVTSDPVTRFKNGLVVSTAPGFAEAHPEIIQEWLEWRLANPVDVASYQSQMAIGLGLLAEAASFEHKLPQISVPTLILFGAHDKVVPPANADLMASKIQGSQVVILPGAGHFFPIEVPAQAAEAVIQFAK
ncbi:MAG: alpha/beta fold hydrolase [Chloroflexi bacterium]|nr:MAG: alpha/beta fold hydrolase [Chloroflexota bacterium]